MKIVFVTTHLAVIGGHGNFILDYTNYLSKNGHEIIVVAQKIDTKLYKFNKKILLIEIGGPLPSSPIYWLLFSKIKNQYLKILNGLKYDIVCSNLFPTNYICSNVNKKSYFKHIYYCHEPFRFFHDKNFYSKAPLLQKIGSYFLKLFFKKYDISGTINANEVICNSNFTRSRVKEIYSRNSYLNYHIIDTNKKINELSDNFNQKLNLTNEIPLLFTLGLTHHMKGTKELMIIFYRILKSLPETTLLIGGWISKENEIIIKKMIKTLKIPKNKVIKYGYIENNKLNNMYKRATLTVYTAIEEPFGLIPLESMKNGTPVIAFEGGPSETIQDGKTGYIIKNGNLNDFTSKAIKLLKDKNLNKYFSKNGMTHVRKNFSFRKGVSNFESLLYSIFTKKKNY